MAKYTIGLDFGTNSVRALLVGVADGAEVATSVWNYAHGHAGILLDERDPNLARQHPADYLEGMEKTVRGVLAEAAGKIKGFSAEDVIGIGVDTTGSTPIPVDANGTPLALGRFGSDVSAMAWLWKDHTSIAEAEQITAAAEKSRPQYLAKCGGKYSSEWFWSKIWRCAKVAPEVFDAAATWVEFADWIPAVLTGTTSPKQIKRNICTAAHKGMAHPKWGGYPDEAFLASLDPRLAKVRRSIEGKTHSIAESAGGLCGEWAAKLGLAAGTPVAVGALDAHLGAVGCGIRPGSLVKIMGTSGCDMMVGPMDKDLPDIPGLCGIAPESILPGFYGLEAGQAAMGDIYNWFTNVVQPAGLSHEQLTAAAGRLRPGQSGLLSLDWHNGNRTILVDQRLTGMILGLTLHSTPAEIYRALIEATAFGARTIMQRFEEYGLKVQQVVACGGIAVKNPMAMQIYADVMNRPILVSRSQQTCALGSAMAGAVVAGPSRGGHKDFASAAAAMAGTGETVFRPNSRDAAAYDRLYALYRQLHDAFGVAGHAADLSGVMKSLLAIRDEARA